MSRLNDINLIINLKLNANTESLEIDGNNNEYEIGNNISLPSDDWSEGKPISNIIRDFNISEDMGISLRFG